MLPSKSLLPTLLANLGYHSYYCLCRIGMHGVSYRKLPNGRPGLCDMKPLFTSSLESHVPVIHVYQLTCA